jgi:hypothetical protein
MLPPLVDGVKYLELLALRPHHDVFKIARRGVSGGTLQNILSQLTVSVAVIR